MIGRNCDTKQRPFTTYLFHNLFYKKKHKDKNKKQKTDNLYNNHLKINNFE